MIDRNQQEQVRKYVQAKENLERAEQAFHDADKRLQQVFRNTAVKRFIMDGQLYTVTTDGGGKMRVIVEHIESTEV